jgi:hypothetical protein
MANLRRFKGDRNEPAQVFHIRKPDDHRRIAFGIRRDANRSSILGARLSALTKNRLRQHPRPRVWANASVFKKINREMNVECQTELL